MQINDFQIDVSEQVDVHADGPGATAHRLLTTTSDIIEAILNQDLPEEARDKEIRDHLASLLIDLSSMATIVDIDLDDLADNAIAMLKGENQAELPA